MKKLLLPIMILLLSMNILAQKVSNLSKSNDDCRIMTYDIRNGRGVNDVMNHERIASVIKSLDPDIIALQEVDSITGRSGGLDVLKQLGNYTKMHSRYASAINIDSWKYGIGVLLKRKPLSSKKIPLSGSEEARVLLVV